MDELKKWVNSRRSPEPPQNAYDAGYDEAMGDVLEHLRLAPSPDAPAPAGDERERLALAYIRVRGAHNPTADEMENDEEVRPCAWCRLAADQHIEAARRAGVTLAPSPDALDVERRRITDALFAWAEKHRADPPLVVVLGIVGIDKERAAEASERIRAALASEHKK